MFRAQIRAVLGFGLMLAAASTEARQLDFSVENRIGADSNVFRNSFDRVDDGFYSLSPRVAVREGNSDLNYDFSYQPTYRAYFSTSGVDGFDHRGQATVSWQPTAADTLGMSGIFTSTRSLTIEDQSGPSDPLRSLEESDRDRVERANAEISYDRKLNDVFSVRASGNFNDLDYSRDTNVDSRASTGRLGAQYVLDPITSVGLTGSFRHRDSGGQGRQFTTKTDVWDIGASIQRSLTPTLSISVQAGPSFIRTKEEAPPVTPAAPSVLPDSKSRSTSYFASVIMDKTWQRSGFNASYTRSEASGGGEASSSIVDNVTLDFNHRLSRRLSFSLLGSWIASKEVSNTPGANKRETTQYRVITTVTQRITRQLSVMSQFLYLNQDANQGAVGSESIGDLYIGFLSLRYTFDPVMF